MRSDDSFIDDSEALEAAAKEIRRLSAPGHLGARRRLRRVRGPGHRRGSRRLPEKPRKKKRSGGLLMAGAHGGTRQALRLDKDAQINLPAAEPQDEVAASLRRDKAAAATLGRSSCWRLGRYES